MRSFNEIVQKRGYQFIDEGLTAGVAVDPNASAMRNFIIQAAKEEDPASLPGKYEATKAWIESGTEEMQRELYKILYAFYFHSIIIMVKAKTDSVLVNKFVKNHMNDHHKYHKQDYGKIQEITKGQITQQYEETKFSLKIREFG